MCEHRIKPDPNSGVMPDPIGYFLTWPTYGTWLPGSEQGWIEYKHGWKLPEPKLLLHSAKRMKESTCLLNKQQQSLVESQISETCQHRKWELYAANCRSNHVHVVVFSPVATPKKILSDIKSWCTRRLKEQSTTNRTKWWADRGSTRWIWDEESLATVIKYVDEAQDRKHLDAPARPLR